MAASPRVKLILPPGLGVFMYIFTARQPMEEGGKSKYQACILWPHAEKEKIKPLQDAIISVAKQKWGENAVAMIKAGKLKIPLKNGDIDNPEEELFAGQYYANMSSEVQPGIVDARTQPIFDQAQAYSGCTFRASVNVYTYESKVNKGVALGLNNLMVVKQGPRLDGRVKAEDDFKEYRETGAAAAPASSGNPSGDDLLS